MQYTPRTVLVTGGSGFIGSHFVHQLLSQPELTVINLDKLTYAANPAYLADCEEHPHYHFAEGDIADRELVRELLHQYSIDTVVNFAAESHVDNSISGPEAFIQTNIVGTFHLLEILRQEWLVKQKLDETQCRFHHISTDEVYGSLSMDAKPFSEQSPYDPSSPYSASKASADHLVKAYGRTYGLPVTLSNCSNNYGPHQHAEKLIPTIIRSCITKQPIPVYGQGKNIRDWIYVKDHCLAVEQIIRHGCIGDSYNVGGGNEWTNLDLVRFICQILDGMKPCAFPYESLIEFVKDREGHDLRYAIDAKLLHNVIPIRYHSVEEKLSDTIEWYLQHML